MSQKVLLEGKTDHGEPGGARHHLGGNLAPKEAQMTPLIKSGTYYGGICVFLFNKNFTKFICFNFLRSCKFCFYNILYMRVNLEKSRLEAAASLGAGGRRPFGGRVPAPPKRPKRRPWTGAYFQKILWRTCNVEKCKKCIVPLNYYRKKLGLQWGGGQFRPTQEAQTARLHKHRLVWSGPRLENLKLFLEFHVRKILLHARFRFRRASTDQSTRTL